MTGEDGSQGLNLGCWESRKPQNTLETKFDRNLEMVFLACTKVRDAPIESPPEIYGNK